MSPAEEPGNFRLPKTDLLIGLVILLATFAAWSSVLKFGFIKLDDASYVYENSHLRAGLNSHTLHWLLVSFEPDNWFPVTRLSFYLDHQLFGLSAGWYHAENLLIHSLSALVLFGFLIRATGARWPSAFVAAMFALHPLHVESVAWVAERKDVLCAFFWFATLWAWLRYRERLGVARYLAALALFSLGLMSKPMIVTLPFLLLVVDYWPLRTNATLTKRVVEKIPFFVLSAANIAMTLAAQRDSDALQGLSSFPLPLRLENAVVTVVIYIRDTLWPARLWALHTYPRSIPLWEVALAAAGIAAVTLAAWSQRNRRLYLIVGWLWFLGTLIPVIGIVQVGLQGRADRYMYVPMVGLSLMLAWGGAEIAAWRPRLKPWTAALAAAACLAMALCTWRQVQYWRDFDTVMGHTLAMEPDNYVAVSYFARVLLKDHPDEALEAILEQRRALRLRPDLAALHDNLAQALTRGGMTEEGIAEHRAAVRIEPESAVWHQNLAFALAEAGHLQEAEDEYNAALRVDPRAWMAHINLGALLMKIPGRSREGLGHFETAAAIAPYAPETQISLGFALADVPERRSEAIYHLEEALLDDPNLIDVHQALGELLSRVPGMEVEAGDHLETARRLRGLVAGDGAAQ